MPARAPRRLPRAAKSGLRPEGCEHNVAAGDSTALAEEISLARKRFGLSRSALVYSCYEAGRDGFWIHHALEALGLINVIVDPSSIEVPLRKRRAKTDRLDVTELKTVLRRAHLTRRDDLSILYGHKAIRAIIDSTTGGGSASRP